MCTVRALQGYYQESYQGNVGVSWVEGLGQATCPSSQSAETSLCVSVGLGTAASDIVCTATLPQAFGKHPLAKTTNVEALIIRIGFGGILHMFLRRF